MEFEFTKVNFDAVQRTVSLKYRFQDDEELLYTETLQLPLNWPIRDISLTDLQPLLESLHLACGVGYWKKKATDTISRSMPLTAEQADFWNTFYSEGMGEFYYTNRLPFRRNLFRKDVDTPPKAIDISLSNRVLVGVSGGKDSLVTVEALTASNVSFVPFLIRTTGQRDNVEPIFKEIGKPPFVVERTLDSQLFLTDSGYKGHVPISAIYAFIAVLCGVLYDFNGFIVSNERSSNYGNVEYEGITVNHQWSKSWRFESLFRKYCECFLVSNFSYFSFLRPLSELAIMKQFVQYPRWYNLLSSCNRVLRQRIDKTRWCGECPKCAFAFLLLAAFLDRSTVVKIFGIDMFEDPKLFSTFDELFGRTGNKPFDCVGTPEEVQAAFCLIADRGQWQDSLLMQHLQPFLPSAPERARLIEKEFQVEGILTIPQPWKNVFENNFL